MKILEFKKGDVIFRQGDFARDMYDVLSGSVGVYLGFSTEHEKEINVLHQGEFLGEMGIIEAYPRSATAVAMEDGTRLQEIDDREFSDYFSDKPERLLLMMRQLSQRLRERTEDYQAACRTLDEMRQTKDTPGKRSKSLKDKIKEFIAFYNDAMEYDRQLGCMSESDIYLMQAGYPDLPHYFH